MPAALRPGGRATASFVERPRLLAALGTAPTRRLTAIIAGAGTGKTTLLRQWACTRPAVWHTATAGDTIGAVFPVLLAAVSSSVGRADPELAIVAAAAGTPPAANDPARADALAASLCELVDAGGRDLTFIVDDVHDLDPAGGAVDLVAALVRHAPSSLHVVLASRDPIPFPTARLILDGHADEVVATELAFTLDETLELLGPGHIPADAEALVERTGGWAVAVAFAARAGATRDDGDGWRDRECGRLIGAYLVDEVIGAERPDMLAALSVAADLPWLTAELADHLGLGDAGRELADTRHVTVSMTPTPEWPGAVTVVPLVREELLRGRHDPRRRAVHLAMAAAWYSERGALGAALQCLIRLDDGAAIAAFARAHGADLISAGQVTGLAGALDRLAPELVDEPLAILAAEAALATGDWSGAQLRYERLAPSSGPVPAAIAWRLGCLHYLRGDTEGAADVMGRGALDAGASADEAALLAWTAAIHWGRGDRDKAFELASEALRRAAADAADRSMATAHTVLAMIAAVDGDRDANYAHYRQALDHAERARDLHQIVRIRCNRGSHFIEQGEYDRALEELDIAVRLADLGGYAVWRALSMTNRAEVLTVLGRLDEAVAELDGARSILRPIGSRLDAYPLTRLGDVYLARGQSALARTAFEQAVDLTSDPFDPQGLVPALTGLAIARIEDDPHVALELARRAASIESAVARPRALVILGRAILAVGDRREAAALAATAAALARSRRDRPALALSFELAAAVDERPEQRRHLLDDAKSLWEQLGSPLGVGRVTLGLAELSSGTDAISLAGSAAETLSRIGAKRSAARARSIATALRPDSCPPIAAQVLGGFAIARHGTPVPPSAWQSKVARDLFKMLAINRGRAVARGVLIERLWPHDTGERANNRLSVALSTIRSILDPDREHPADFIVRSDRDGVALDVTAVDIDFERFLAEAEEGRRLITGGERERGLAVLRHCEARYVGDLLEGQPYDDWSIPAREEALTTYLWVAARLADADAVAGEPEAAAARYLRMLEHDPFAEHAHLGAVRAMRAAGHHGQARRVYANYVTKMTEIDVEPVPFPH